MNFSEEYVILCKNESTNAICYSNYTTQQCVFHIIRKTEANYATTLQMRITQKLPLPSSSSEGKNKHWLSRCFYAFLFWFLFSFLLLFCLFLFLFFSSYVSFCCSFYSMEYARITSTIGARHNGHFPPPLTNSFAHFEQVHM